MSKKHWGNIRAREAEEEYKRGWVAPDSDNLGPGNEVRIGPAGRNEGDVRARGHDIRYGNEIEEGVNPYVNWVDADEEFLDGYVAENWKDRAAQALFSVKKALKGGRLVGDMSGKRKAKPIRTSPWEEGQEHMTARHKRTRLRKAAMGETEWMDIGGTDPFAGRGEHARQIALQKAMQAQDDEDSMPPLEDWPDNEVRGMDVALPEEEDNSWANEDTNVEMNVDAQGNWWETHGNEVIDINSLPNLPASEQMSEAVAMDTTGGEEVTAMAARSGGGGPGNTVSKETPISPYPSLSYGLQETHTTILPWVGWMSVALPEWGVTVPTQLKIRMNTPYDFINSTLTASPAVNTAPTTNGLYAVPLNQDGKRGNNINISFPESISTGANAAERPAWRDYWAALYDYYTVLGCEYKITMYNPSSAKGQGVIVGTTFDTYSDTATTTGNVMPPSYLSEVMAYKNMKWQILESNSPEYENSYGSVTGRYKPGQAKRNIVNDGDVKTWTLTGATQPNLKEDLVINFWRSPMSFYDGNGTTNTMTNPTCLNMQLEIKYIVQFKDLKQQARYPNRLTTNQDITQILNEDPTAAGTAHQKWG